MIDVAIYQWTHHPEWTDNDMFFYLLFLCVILTRFFNMPLKNNYHMLTKEFLNLNIIYSHSKLSNVQWYLLLHCTLPLVTWFFTYYSHLITALFYNLILIFNTLSQTIIHISKMTDKEQSPEIVTDQERDLAQTALSEFKK